MRITIPNLFYSIRNPLRALRYLRWRDVISYQTIAEYIPEKPTIVEAGAFNGNNTLEMAACWPNAVIHAFEPVETARDLLSQKIAPHTKSIHVYPYALGATSGTFQMHISGEGSSGGTQSSSFLKPTAHTTAAYSFLRFESKADVSVVRLDDWATRRGITQLDFLWLDLQGFELEALKGAGDLLSTVSAVHAEVSNVELYEGAPLYPEVLAWMRSHGFIPVAEALFRIGGNVLFVREKRTRRFAVSA
jgi:FkbM family methyltransferase